VLNDYYEPWTLFLMIVGVVFKECGVWGAAQRIVMTNIHAPLK